MRYSIIVAMVLVSACATPDPSPQQAATPDWPVAVETMADSIALKALEFSGGAEAWRSLPYARFDFSYRPGDAPRPPRKHLWDRMGGDYRLEYRQGEDSVYVVLFNTQTREGKAFVNGSPLSPEEAEQRVEAGYGAFINDSYWLMMPAKLLDPGVNRRYVADSSDASTAVLNLTFGEVGLTPGDTYWVWVDRESGQVRRWAYVLQRNTDAKPTHWRWTGWQSFEMPSGTIRMAPIKENDRATIRTDALELPTEIDATLFSDPAPRLF